MKVSCGRLCGFVEHFDDAHQPPILFCPYCGATALEFRDEISGRKVPRAQIRLLRRALWPAMFGRAMLREEAEARSCCGLRGP